MQKGVHDRLKLLSTSYNDNMNIIKKAIKHTMLVTKHRWYVFKLAFKVGITYNPKTWTTSQPLEYWINVEKQKPTVVHPATIEYIEIVFKNLEKEGIEKTINSQYLKKCIEIYQKNIILGYMDSKTSFFLQRVNSKKSTKQ